MTASESKDLRPSMGQIPGLVTSVSVVLVQPTDLQVHTAKKWLSGLDPSRVRSQEVLRAGSGEADLSELLAGVEGDFVIVIGPSGIGHLDQALAAIEELFREGGDAAVLGPIDRSGNLVPRVCTWLWAGATGEQAEAVVIRRFAARWLFAGLDATAAPDIEVQARALGMALRLVIPGEGVINPPDEWTEHFSSLEA